MNEEVTTKVKKPSSQEVILYRLDGIEQQLTEVKNLLVETALQEQRIKTLEKDVQECKGIKDQIVPLKIAVESLTVDKTKSKDKSWAIILCCLSPLISAIVAWLINGGSAK